MFLDNQHCFVGTTEISIKANKSFINIKKHHLKDVYNDEGFTSVMGLTYGVMLRLEQIFWAIMGVACYASLVKSNPSDA